MDLLVADPVAKKTPDGATFGAHLRAIRAAAGMTQAQLAELTGLHLITVSKLERDIIEPSWATVQLIAAALGKTPNDFSGPIAVSADPAPPPKRRKK